MNSNTLAALNATGIIILMIGLGFLTASADTSVSTGSDIGYRLISVLGAVKF